MSLPKTLETAHNKLDEAEGLIQLHSQEVVNALKEDQNYRGSYEEKLAETYVEASTHAMNAETQFFNYDSDFRELLDNEQRPGEVSEQHDIPSTLNEYVRAFETAVETSNRYRKLNAQMKAISDVMEQNGMGNLWDKVQEKHPWYREPEDTDGFRKATNM